MKYVMIVLCFFLFGLQDVQAQVKSTPAPQSSDQSVQPEDVLVGLARRDARRLGLTITGIAKIARELKAENALTGNIEADAESILAKAIEQNPKAFADPSLDWDAILAFIERIMPLILMIIGLF